MAMVPKALPATGTSTLRTGAADFGGFAYLNGSGGAGVITFYDNTAASGRVIYQESVAAGVAVSRVLNPPVTVTIGLTVNLSAASGSGAAWLD